MIMDRMDRHPGARFLFILACLVVIVAGLRAAAPILVPFALAMFLAVVSMPVMFWLRLRRVPNALAISLTVLMDIAIFAALVLLASNSLQNLEPRLNAYESAFNTLVRRWTNGLRDSGLLPEDFGLTELFNFVPIFDFVGVAIAQVASVVSLSLIVAIIMVFVLAEATVFPYKFQSIFGQNRQNRQRLTKTIQEVQAYLGLKTLISLATGIFAGFFCAWMNLDFPILLGMIAFVLNYIPTIGSIIAAIPALILAMILPDVNPVWQVALGYVAINTLFGNVIEPNLMGRRLGLSTLVVILSLLFWGWVWGPAGALLSVPLTMVLKIALENTPDLRWIAILLDKAPPQARAAAAMEARRKAAAKVPADEEDRQESISEGLAADGSVSSPRAAG